MTLFNGNYLIIRLTVSQFKDIVRITGLYKVPALMDDPSLGIIDLSLSNLRSAVIPIGWFSNFEVDIPSRLYDYVPYEKFISTSNKEFELTQEEKNQIILPELFTYQQEYVNKIEETITRLKDERRPIYVTLNLPCGYGKTILSIYNILKDEKKAIICVPNKSLAKQWSLELSARGARHVSSTNGAKYLLKILDKPPNILIIISKHLKNRELCKFMP